MLESKTPLEIVCGLYRGRHVKIKSGPLKGMVGECIRRQNGRFLAIHISILGRTVLAVVKPYDVEPY